MLDGLILEIQRMSTEDGPGLRTTVFLKGCPLRCAWCHNPESISPQPQLQWISARCIGCHTCANLCEFGALTWHDGGIDIDRALCRGCGRCADVCPGTALELWGRRITPADLVRELVKDRAYFEKSGGGVTLSGGEATAQAEFSLEVLRGLKRAGIGTALDTCGLCRPETLDALVEWTDVVLYDLKLMDSVLHRDLCGAGNERIIENLLRVAGTVLESGGGKALWIRTPLIPGATATAENIGAIGQFIATRLNGAVERWDLCAFNHLGRDKYVRLGIDWAYRDTPLLSAEWLRDMGDVARRSGVMPEIVRVSGATSFENQGD